MNRLLVHCFWYWGTCNSLWLRRYCLPHGRQGKFSSRAQLGTSIEATRCFIEVMDNRHGSQKGSQLKPFFQCCIGRCASAASTSLCFTDGQFGTVLMAMRINAAEHTAALAVTFGPPTVSRKYALPWSKEFVAICMILVMTVFSMAWKLLGNLSN